MTTVGRFTVWIIAAVLVVIVVYFAGYRVADTLPAVLALALGNVGGESPKQWDIHRGVVGLGPALLDTRETNY